MVRGFFEGLNERGVSPVIAIVLLLMMTVAAAGAAYFWLTQMQSGIQEQSTKSIENIMQSAGRRLVAQAAICEPTAPNGIVGWWEFYEGEGNKTHDSSENENIGTINGANWTDGKVGRALDFDGSDNVGFSSPDFTKSLTITAWVKFASQRDYSTIVSGEHGSWSNAYWFWCDSADNKLSLTINGNHHTKSVGENIQNDVWYHFAVTYDGSQITYFFNGEQVNTASETAEITDEGTGGIGKATNYYMDGSIDEPRIYDRALSAEEINETYKGKMKVKVTVRNIGSVEIPEAKFVANLKKDGTTVDSDTYVTKSSIDTGDLKTLTFYFNEMRPGGEYTVSIPGIDVSQTVKCQSLE